MRIWAALLGLLFANLAHAGGYLAPVEHDDDSVIVNLPLWQEESPDQFFTGGSHTTTGLTFDIVSDRSSGDVDTFSQSDSTLEACGSQGTFSTPTATKARICETSAAGVYQLQLPNEVYAASNATRLDIKVTDGANTSVLDDWWWVDLTPVSSAGLIDALLDASTSGYATSGDVGYILGTLVPAIHTDTGTTLDNKLDTITTNTERNVILAGGDIDTVTSQTVLVDSDGDVPADDDAHIGDFFCVKDIGATPEDVQCAPIEDYASTGTFTIDAGHIKFTIATSDTYWIERGGSNVEMVNEVDMKGIGTSGNPWAPDD